MCCFDYINYEMNGKNNTVPNINKEKHKPVRMCTSCRKRALKEQLLRIVNVKAKEHSSSYTTVRVDEHQKLSGRGMYICHSTECFNKLKKDVKKNKKKFLCNVNSDDLFAEIERALKVFEV